VIADVYDGNLAAQTRRQQVGQAGQRRQHGRSREGVNRQRRGELSGQRGLLTRQVAPGPTGFPPSVAQPGAIGVPGYSPLIQLPNGVIENAPQIARDQNGDGVITLGSESAGKVGRSISPPVQIRLLGSLGAVSGDGVEFELPSARLVRAVLEILALRAGAVVQTWELIDSVWGDGSPVTVRKSLQTCITRLRQALGSETIETLAGGYRLRVDPADVDLNQFETHIGDGSDRLKAGDLHSAVAHLAAALALWRGQPLEELVDSPGGMVVRARLSELRAMAEECLYEARLRLGEHDAVVADLQAAVRAEPFRERRWGQLMLALYRSGREVDALAAFERLQALLDEHGLFPGDDVRALKATIAARHPSLAWCSQPGLETPPIVGDSGRYRPAG
jgi:DNA-binding SARP family transcriptional activator